MKNSSINIQSLFLWLLLLAIGFTACTKSKPEPVVTEDNGTLKHLYGIYKDGAIDACKLNGQIVYCGEYNNVTDGSKFVYDMAGNLIATCNYRSPMPDSVCLKLSNCETIYRVKDNFWGLPEVDAYGLGK